jgi:adenylyltransferase/sulfurtransferase
MMRYLRQMPILDKSGQRRLEGSKVAVIGLGGLGCNVVTHLASSGVMEFLIADGGSVEMSDLNRQFIYSCGDIGKNKAERAAEWIKRVNPEAVVKEVDEFVNLENVSMIGGCDIIMDCLDNHGSRMTLNRFAFDNGIGIVHGGVESMFGQVTVAVPHETPCLECILPDAGNDEITSISPMVGMIGAIQALEAVKVLSGVGSALAGKLLTIDASENSYRVLDVKRREGCGCCSSYRK